MVLRYCAVMSGDRMAMQAKKDGCARKKRQDVMNVREMMLTVECEGMLRGAVTMVSSVDRRGLGSVVIDFPSAVVSQYL